MARQINTAPSRQKKDKDEPEFQKWYGDWASKHKMNPDPDDKEQHYDYRAAYRQGVKPPNTTKGEHWASTDKDEGHPNLIVGGFNTKTGERVVGTKQGTEKELRDSGWDAESAKRLTRNNTGTKHPKDVNLPIDTSPSNIKKRKK